VRERDGLEARAHTHSAKELADVVANGLLAQLQLVRNLAGGAALRQVSKNLGLSRRQPRIRRRRQFHRQLGELPEDADHAPFSLEGERS
jgi:hypothetical protein